MSPGQAEVAGAPVEEEDDRLAGVAAGEGVDLRARRAAAAARSRHQPSGRAPMTLLPSTIQRILRKGGAPLATVRPVRLGSRLICAALVACALVPSRRGGGSSDDGGAAYVQRVNKAQQDFAARVDGCRRASPRRRRRRATADAALVRGRGRRGGRRPAGDQPPEKVRGLHDRLVRAVDGYGDDVTTAAKALDSESPATLRAAQRDLQQATAAFGTTLNETIDRINKTLNG